MRSYGGLAPATALLLLLSLITESLGVEVKITERTKRAAHAKRDTNKILVEEIIFGRNKNMTRTAGCGKTEEPTNINNQLLALLTSASKSKRSSDQQADQSEAVIIDVEGLGDLDKLERALSMVEYEPQRISTTKTKRKSGNSWSDTNDAVEASNENAGRISAGLTKPYYEVGRTGKRKNTARTGRDSSSDISPRPFSRAKPVSRSTDSLADNGTQDPLAIKRRLKASSNKKGDLEYEKASAIRRGRGRQYNNRLQAIPEVSGAQLTPAEETKFHDMKAGPFSPAYSASSTAVRRTKYVGANVENSRPPASVNSQTYASRSMRRKSRKEPTRSKLDENTHSSSKSYNSNASQKVPRNAVIESDEKSRRFALLGKYEAAPRPFGSKRDLEGGGGGLGVNSREEESSRQVDRRAKYVIGNVNAGSNREIQVAAGRVNNGRGRNVYNARNQEGFQPSLAQQVNAQEDLTASIENLRDGGYKKSEEPDKLPDLIKVGVVPSFNAHKESVEIDSTRNANPNGEALERRLYNGDPTAAAFRTTASPSQLHSQSYENINTQLPHASQSSQNSPLSTIIPYTTLNRQSTLSANPSAITSRSSSSHSGTLQRQDPNSQSSETHSNNYRSSESESSEEVAQPSTLEAEQQDGDSRERTAGYAIRENPNEGRSIEDSSNEGSSHHANHHGGTHAELKTAHAGGGGGGKKYEKGGGTGQGEDHHQSKGEKGEKGYKSWHEDDKASKGHHDKERHTNYYDENDGKEKESKEKGGYHEDYKKGEKGEKAAEFGEKGKHEKGHSTKGQHVIHKKDEFEKKTEFFDEFHEEGDIEKDGGFLEEHEFSKGGHEKSSHHKDKKLEEKYGKEGKHEKGGHYSDHKGRKISEGKDSDYDHKEAHGKKGAHQEGKKWGYKHAPSTSTGHHKDG